MCLDRVLLPLPLCPAITRKMPSGMVRSTPLSTSGPSLSYRNLTPFASIISLPPKLLYYTKAVPIKQV